MQRCSCEGCTDVSSMISTLGSVASGHVATPGRSCKCAAHRIALQCRAIIGFVQLARGVPSELSSSKPRKPLLTTMPSCPGRPRGEGRADPPGGYPAAAHAAHAAEEAGGGGGPVRAGVRPGQLAREAPHDGAAGGRACANLLMSTLAAAGSCWRTHVPRLPTGQQSVRACDLPDLL